MSQKMMRMENDLVKKDRLIAEERRKAQEERRKAQRKIEALSKALVELGADPDLIEYSD